MSITEREIAEMFAEANRHRITKKGEIDVDDEVVKYTYTEPDPVQQAASDQKMKDAPGYLHST